jgi:hypothetical protein
LQETPEIQTVILGFFGNYLLDSDLAAEHLTNHLGPKEVSLSSKTLTGTKAELFYAGLDASIAQLQDAGKRVVLFTDVPEVPFLPRSCLIRPGFGSAQAFCGQAIADVHDRQDASRAVVAKLQAAHPQLQVFDTRRAVCDDKSCPLQSAGHFLYRDSHHLSVFGSEKVADMFLNSPQAR